MQTHLEKKQSSEGLASIAVLSPFHFNRVFRLLTGIPPACFLAALRLEKAKSLLLTTDASVTDVCFDVGYSSLGTFVSRFTQMVGVSPNALRRAAKAMNGCDLREFIDAAEVHDTPDMPQLCGEVVVPLQFEGLVALGLYDDLLPHARPTQCATLRGSGRFAFEHLPGGIYTVAAAALPYQISPASFLNRGLTLRSASPPTRVDSIGGARIITLPLRATMPFDPPILAPLPLMLLSRRGIHPSQRFERAIGEALHRA
jgi:AraC-like DNA-binding protein